VSRSLLVLALTGCGRIAFDDVTGGIGAGDGYADAVLADSPIAYFRFNELNGPTASSVVGSITGTYEGNFEFGEPGAFAADPCVRFDNATTRISVGDVFEFAGNAAYSVELWVKPTTINDTRFLVKRRTTASPSDGYSMYYGKDYFLGQRTTSDVEMGYVDYGMAAVNEWTHAVFTYNGTQQRLYINGAFEQSSNPTGMTPIGSGPGTFTIGDNDPPQFKKIDGWLDELAIYDHSLTGAQVSAHFAAAQ